VRPHKRLWRRPLCKLDDGHLTIWCPSRCPEAADASASLPKAPRRLQRLATTLREA
jgi:hypothetical protein